MANWREVPAPVPEEEITATYKADVVIVGLGYAGTAALRAAAEAGADVIGLEVMDRERYNCFGRDIGHINSEFLASRGVPKVDPIDFYNEMIRRAGNRVNPSLVMQFAQNCGETFDWYTSMYGIEGLKDLHVAYMPEGGKKFKASGSPELNGGKFWYGTAQFPEPMCWPGGPTPPDVVKANWAIAEEHGARLFFRTNAEQPIMDGERVAGVMAKDRDSNWIRFWANKAVVLAAGDFSGNQEMVQELVTDYTDLLPEGAPFPKDRGRKGKGVQMGVWAGGRLEPRPIATMGGNQVTVPGVANFGILWLNRDGKRFCNETYSGPEFVGFAGNQMPLGTYYNIFDENVLEDLQWAPPAHGSFEENGLGSVEAVQTAIETANAYPKGNPEALKEALSGNKFAHLPEYIYSGATPEELVANAGIEGELADQIVASIKRYNEVCRAGRDDDFGKDARLLRPLDGRLYMQPSEIKGIFASSLVTVGGLVTDEYQNVLNGKYERIPGLYATGNCCGRRFGPAYTTPIPGVSIGMAVTLGREVGKVVGAL